MDDTGRILWGFILSLFLLGIGMLFTATQTAVLSLSDNRLKTLQEEKNQKARRLLRLKERRDFKLQTGISFMFCIVPAAIIARNALMTGPGFGMAKGLDRFLTEFFNIGTDPFYYAPSWSYDIANGIVSFFLLFICFIVCLTFGYVLPQKLSQRNPEKTALALASPLAFFLTLLTPLTGLVLVCARGILRLFGIDPNLQGADITEEEIRMLVDAGNESGTIELSEREMINNIFEFDDRVAGDVMTHRTEISGVSQTDTMEALLRISVEEGFSRIPVYGDDMDNIVGIIYVKDLLSLVGHSEIENKTLTDYIRPVIYVPESIKCMTLFLQFQEKKTHMAVVVDEYGGTAGIVTMEDLIESIVGNIQDEYDQEDEEINQIAPDIYSLDGSLPVEEVEKLFQVSMTENDDADTLGGLIANTLGRIPAEEETPSVTLGGVQFTVLLVEDRRIVRVKAERLPLEEIE